jgi:SAM-dependent methyltransferase
LLGAGRRLEVAPGLRPRLPINGTHFVDISAPALTCLHEHGGRAVLAPATALPFANAAFELVCALDVIEHVEDGDAALAELARVVTDNGTVLLSVPLYPELWTSFDELVGHARRYEPAALIESLRRCGLVVERSASFGMHPRSARLVALGMWFLMHRRKRAMWWYNRVFMPLALRLEAPLALVEGIPGSILRDGLLLVCRKRACAK